MSSNLTRFKKDLAALLAQGQLLDYAMRRKASGAEKFDVQIQKQLGDKAEVFLKKLPSFEDEYQGWYSEAMAVIQQLLTHRLDDFKRHYEKPKSRKEITYENYHIEDFLQGLRVTRHGGEVVVDSAAAVPRFTQQMAILSAAERRFDSSLFEIRQLVQADLFDSEIEVARELLKKKFTRAAGAIAGVVLEKHLAQVCEDRGIKIAKKNPTISDFNELLKISDVVDTAQWRFVQHLADLRNLCDHNKKAEPTADQVGDLLDGVAKVMKTVR